MCVKKCFNLTLEKVKEPWFILFCEGFLKLIFTDCSECYSAEKQSMEQARLIQRQEDEHEADGEEDDDEDEEEEDQDEVWRRRRRGSPEGRPEPKGQGFSDEALRKRVVGKRAEEEEDEEEEDT